jgi:CRP/FNR family transcriptional regulator, cyclic AMP receptor protein
VDAKQRTLAQVPLFAGLRGREIEELGRLADEVEIRAGTELTREGRSGDEFFVLLEGSVRVERDGGRIATLGPGDFLGEIALIDGGPRSATAVAEGPVRALVLGHREFDTLMDDFPGVARAVLLAFAQRVRRVGPNELT